MMDIYVIPAMLLFVVCSVVVWIVNKPKSFLDDCEFFEGVIVDDSGNQVGIYDRYTYVLNGELQMIENLHHKDKSVFYRKADSGGYPVY